MRKTGVYKLDKIKIAITDDEKLIRESLKIILGSDPNIDVIGLCENGEEAFLLCKDKEIDVMLMDIRMPVCDGVKATKLIKETCNNTKILILTTFNDDEYIFDAMNFGASGYILKDTSHDIILDSIKGVHIGNVIMNPKVAEKMLQNRIESPDNQLLKVKEEFKLTPRELGIVIAISEGLTNKEIGDKLFLTEGTVKNHITEILSKLQLRDRTQIAIFAFKNNLMC